jgi:Skp family chaperone for outer membrane proteins
MSEKKTYRFQTIVVEDVLRAEYSALRDMLGSTDKQLFTAIWELLDHDALAEKVAEMKDAAKNAREAAKLQKEAEKLQKKVDEQQKKIAANTAILEGAEESDDDDADFELEELDEVEEEAPTIVVGL